MLIPDSANGFEVLWVIILIFLLIVFVRFGVAGVSFKYKSGYAPP